MLWTIAVILLILWLLGMVSFHALGAYRPRPARARDYRCTHPNHQRTQSALSGSSHPRSP